MLKFDWKESGLSHNLVNMDQKAMATTLMFAATQATVLTSLMKQRRPWTDRTNMAKALLNTQVSQVNSETVRLTLSHGVQYGIWLELANEKNYAVILPTLISEGPKVINGFQGLFKQMKV